MIAGFILVVLCTIIGLLILLNRWRIRKNGIETVAIVVRSEEGGTTRSRGFHPVLQYMVAGKSFEVKYSGGNIRTKYANGETVRIYYHKKNPEIIMMPDNKTNFISGIGFLCFGLLVFVAIIARLR